MKLKLKKINTESPNYALVRGTLDYIAGLGGIVITESISLPCAYALFKSKPLRFLSILGTIGLSTYGYHMASTGMDLYADTVVDLYNDLCDFVSSEDDIPAEDPVVEPVPDVIDVPKKSDIDDWVANTGLFYFEKRVEASRTCEALVNYIKLNGFGTLRDLFEIRGKDSIIRPYDGSEFYGWTLDDISKNELYIDDLSDGADEGPYVASLIGYYHDISSVYITNPFKKTKE